MGQVRSRDFTSLFSIKASALHAATNDRVAKILHESSACMYVGLTIICDVFMATSHVYSADDMSASMPSLHVSLIEYVIADARMHVIIEFVVTCSGGDDNVSVDQ